MTWPVSLNLTTAIPGDGFDGWQNYWNLWSVKQTLLVDGSNPYFTDYLYAPTGVSLLFHTLNILNGLWTLPVQLNFGLAIAYNSVVFLSFILAGYGGYLLSLYTLSRLGYGSNVRLAAFVGGLIFTMSPFHFAHLLGHMQVFSMIWPPFYILWLLKLLEPTTGHYHVWRNISLATLFLILTTLVALYHTLYLLIFTSLTLLWTVWQRRHHPPQCWAMFGKGLGVMIMFTIFMAPLLIALIQQASNRPDLETGLSQNIALSADLLAFITPSEMHPLWGEWATRIANNFTSTTSERLIFVGFTPLAIALFAIFTLRSVAIVRFWGLIGLTFFVLAIGPFLHIYGQPVTIGDWPIPMPYMLLYHVIPFLDLTRSLSRYSLILMLALGVLTAIGLAHLQTRPAKKSSSGWLITIGAIGLICFEFLPIPYPLSPIQMPQFYQELAADKADYTIAVLPMNWDRPEPLLHQTVHQKRLLTAYTSRNNPLELAWRTPIFQQWRTLQPDIINQPLADIAPTIFYDFNVRYVVLDYWQMPPNSPDRTETERWVQAALPNVQPIYDDGRLKVYQTPAKTATMPYLSLGNGWSQLTENGSSGRWLTSSEQPAELHLHHPQHHSLTLTLSLFSPTDAVKQLTIWADNKALDPLTWDQSQTEVSLALPTFSADFITLQLQNDTPERNLLVRQIRLESHD